MSDIHLDKTNGFSKRAPGTREMAPMVNWLPGNCEDWSLLSRTHLKKPGVVVTGSPALGRWTGTWLADSRTVRDSVSRKQGGQFLTAVLWLFCTFAVWKAPSLGFLLLH